MKTGKPNTLLIELVIVLLFFSLSAAVILQLFVATHDRQLRNEVESGATLLAEDISARFAASDLDAKVFFAADGWAETEGGYSRTTVVAGRTLTLSLEGAAEQTAAGKLDDFLLTILRDGERVVSLPLARYIPGEETL